MNAIQPVTLQSMSSELGHEVAIRYCAPLSFYMVLYALGAVPKDVIPGAFCAALDKANLTVDGGDWSRPALSRYMRQTYKVPVISWQLEGEANVDLMKRAGYLESEQEIKFFLKNVYGKSVRELVQAGYPVIVTMEPGFGADENKNIHAVIIAKWVDGVVTVVDSDARNTKSEFSEERVLRYLSKNGAGTIVLPTTQPDFLLQ